MKILIADKLSPVGIEWLESQADVEFDNRPGLSSAELAEIVGEYDGMIIRSGAKVTAEVLENHGRLRGIARAGEVGRQNAMACVPCRVTFRPPTPRCEAARGTGRNFRARNWRARRSA